MSATAFRTHRGGALTRAEVGPEGTAGRLGTPAPGPRRTRLHRPARPRWSGAALLQSCLDTARRHGARRRPGRRDRHPRQWNGRAPPGTGPRSEPHLARGRGARDRSRDRRTGPDAGHSGGAEGKGRAAGRGAPAAASGARPPPAGAAAQPRPPPPADAGDAPLLRPAGLSRDRDADPDQADARRRARLSGAEPGPPGRVLRAAAVAPDLQAAADGGGLRPLLPDRALLSRRGSAGRPAAGVHPDRHRGLVRRGRGCARRSARVWSTSVEEAGQPIGTPIPALAYREAMERYGSDKPDLRYGLEIFDATDVFRGADFVITRQAMEAGGRVRGIRVPGGASLSRKQVDEIEAAAEVARRGRSAPAAAQRRCAGRSGSEVPRDRRCATRWARRRRPLALRRRAGPRLQPGARPGAAGAGPAPESHSSRAQPRLSGSWTFRCSSAIPQTGQLGSGESSVHRAAPGRPRLAGDGARNRCAPWPTTWCYNGTELGGGSLRIADPELQRRIFALLGIPDEEAQRRFGFLLEGLRAGAPPHGGFAFGMDRIVMLLAGADSLRDVIAFPKTTAARALFEGAPTPVDPADLRALHLEATSEK